MALQRQKQILEASLGGPNWLPNVVDPAEPLLDDPSFWMPLFASDRLPPTLDKTRRGELLPIYITWYGLKVLRDMSRRICTYNEFAVNILENRINYTCGRGYQYKVVPTDGKDSADVVYLCKLSQRWIDVFTAGQNWNEKEQEAVRRCDRDGECFLRFFHVGNGYTEIRFIEPEWVKSLTDQDWETYGIVNAPQDVGDVLGFNVIQAPPYTQAIFVPAEEILHIKGHLGTDSNTKRGLPSLFPVRKNLSRVEALLQNMSTLAAVQATFALIRQHKGYSRQSVNQFQQNQADTQWTDPYSGQQAFSKRYGPGSIIDAPQGMEYIFPSSTVNAGALVAILDAELRAIGAAVQMPEFMVGNNAQNANFACHSQDSHLLTRRGWLSVDEVRHDDLAATMNPNTGEFEWQPIDAIHIHDYDGEMISVKSRDVDMLVTPNHRMYTSRVKSKIINGKLKRIGKHPFSFKRADELRVGDILPLATNQHVGIAVGGIEIPSVQCAPGGNGLECLGGKMPADAFLEYIGWWVAEGWSVGGSVGKNGKVCGYTAFVTQSAENEAECGKIRSAVACLPVNASESGRAAGSSYPDKRMIDWKICSKALVHWLKANCGDGAANKRLPEFVFDLDARQKQIVLDALLLGDGHHRKSGSASFYSTSSLLVDQVQTLALQCGYVANVCKPLKGTNGPVHNVSVRLPKQRLKVRPGSVSRVQYSGKVWCVTVPNGLIITRRNGKAIVSGNSIQVTEAPFVKSMERHQSFFARRFGDGSMLALKDAGAMWRVLNNAVRFGGLPREVFDCCEIQVEGPSLIGRDKAQETQRAAMLNQAGVLSKPTWSKWEGVDYDQEQKLIDTDLQRQLAQQALMAQAQLQQQIQAQQAAGELQIQQAVQQQQAGAEIQQAQLQQQAAQIQSKALQQQAAQQQGRQQQELGAGQNGLPQLPQRGQQNIQGGMEAVEDVDVQIDWVLSNPFARPRLKGIVFSKQDLIESGFSGGLSNIETGERTNYIGGIPVPFTREEIVLERAKIAAARAERERVLLLDLKKKE